MDLGLKGRRVLVTGGTRGIGAAIIQVLLSEGASVAFCSRNSEQVTVAEKEWRDAGHTVFGSVCDVADKENYLEWISSAASSLGGVDVFIPNVSAGPGQGEEGWEAAFQVDLMATVRGCEAILPQLAASKGSIVVISSISGLEGAGGPAPYNTVKAGLITYASQLGELAGPHGVRVNCVSPGPIHVDDGFWGEVQRQQPEFYNGVASKQPFGRLGTPKEVANAVVFLASPAASWITRSNLVVDGGFTNRVQF
ncbi:MAG: SDR family NAD(P)-dependent oxidoreductase [Kordiimonas sp.]